MYTLFLDSYFAPFLAKWGKKTKAQPLGGFTDDGETVPEKRRQTDEQNFRNFPELPGTYVQAIH